MPRQDADGFDDLAGKRAARRTAPATGVRPVIAVDGKTSPGSGHGSRDGGRHLLAAPRHAHGAVPGQVQAGAKTNQIPLLSALPDRIDIAAAVITADAPHAQRDHATSLAGHGARHVLIVQRHQPGPHSPLARLPWPTSRPLVTPASAGTAAPGRRTLKVTAAARGLAFPHAARAIQITRRNVKGKWPRQTCHAVTSLTITQASHTQLAAIIRGHRASTTTCTGSATRPSAKTAPRSAPPPARTSRPACATW